MQAENRLEMQSGKRNRNCSPSSVQLWSIASLALQRVHISITLPSRDLRPLEPPSREFKPIDSRLTMNEVRDFGAGKGI